MCDICVMNAVKDRMLSRRGFFKAAAASGVAAATTGVAAPAALAAGHGGVEDMTHAISPDFPTYFGEPGYASEQVFNFAEHGFNVQRMVVNEHTGTHIDAPLHFSADGASVDEIPVSDLVAPLCVVDIAARAAEDADTLLTPDDLKAWMSANGDIPDGACVALYSGWAAKADSDAYRGFDGEAQHYPGFHVEAAQMLMEETGARSIASDTLSSGPRHFNGFRHALCMAADRSFRDRKHGRSGPGAGRRCHAGYRRTQTCRRHGRSGADICTDIKPFQTRLRRRVFCPLSRNHHDQRSSLPHLFPDQPRGRGFCRRCPEPRSKPACRRHSGHVAKGKRTGMRVYD